MVYDYILLIITVLNGYWCHEYLIKKQQRSIIMKRVLKKVTALLLCGSILFGGGSFVSASETNYFDSSESYTRDGIEVTAIYKKAIGDKVLSIESYAYSAWIQLEKTFLWPNYMQVKEEGLIDQTTTYEKWLQDNNYGAVAGFDTDKFEVVRQGRTTAYNKAKFVNTIQKGDFVVVSGVRGPLCIV
ncbi:hypothetical protein HB825_13635 [Listeria booriae]|uniref:hypothetical protein n=1 Tax=Listeria booriae TaxID=1552123 RepID=UPI001626CF53|nr:hypothetical protein [Listeria booriae]MBC2320645.1 hypothetical protein [Listeria booriae]MBC6135880.1 hypothetical protein [Listeria booriae]